MTPADRDVVDLLAGLVAVDSVNPSLVDGGAGEREIAAHVARWAARAGLRAEVVEATPGRPSVIVRTPHHGDGPTLLLCGHLDTVGVGGMHDPWTPRIDGDRLYGRGAYDMKGGLAAALVAAREASGAGIGGAVVVAAVADEEHASIGVQEVLRSVRADAAVVTEPTELAVATAHKGFVWTEITVTGRAAHGSRPHLGVDAILKAGPVLVGLDALDRALSDRTHPLLGSGNLHGSLISGGLEESTIPDRCTVVVERRTLPGETVADVERDIGDLLARCRAADPGLTVRSRTLLAREPFETARTEPIVRAVARAVGETLGRAAEIGGVSYWADAAFISAAGIPTVLFGPDGDGAHAQVEWVSLPGTLACARALTRAAVGFCGR